MRIVRGVFQPKTTLSEQDVNRGLRMLNWQIVAASAADSIASGGFLAAFALILGASAFQIGMMTAIRDITERKKAEEALKESELQLREQKLALEQKNLALKEMIEHIERTKNKLKDDVVINVNETLIPILKKLRSQCFF